MQAIIMAAGKGSRLGNLTENLPKSLLKIKGKTLLEINIAMLHKFGIWDITIVTGFQDQKFIEATNNIPGIKLVYNPFYGFTNVIGSYYMGMNNLHDDFIYLHADTICDITIFEDLLKADGDIILPVDTKPCDEEAMKVRLENGNITEITKQMPIEKAAGEFIGITKIRKSVIDDLNDSATNVLRDQDYTSYFEGALQRVFDMNKYDVRMLDTKDRFWGEVDFLEDYQRAEQNITENLLEL
ncbi:MAG: phosphocholine cytidylyltransferase family protein [Butyrivibrio sp.]|nr:phosphocholine cytidylyltransferase family protein [Butyrivibrio sp.]